MTIEDIQPLTARLRVEQDGTVRVGNTRVTLDVLLGAYKLGRSPKAIVKIYPTLDIADVYAAIAYYLQNEVEVEEYLRVRESEAQEIRLRIEDDPANKALRKLIQRRGWEHAQA